MAAAAIRPAGTTNAASERRKPSRRTGPELLLSARKNAGIPMVSDEVTLRWRGRKGKAIGARPKVASSAAE